MSSESWNVFDGWIVRPGTAPREPDWTAVDDLVCAFSGVIEIRHAELSGLLGVWDQWFSDFGGDPTHTDWSQFRPLRLSREEDWSDWLAYLIQGSSTGVFSAYLFGTGDSKNAVYANPIRVEREVPHHGYRADLIVHWSNGEIAHLEVKVGDDNLFKTFATGAVMRSKYSQDQSVWHNYILLLSHQLPTWDALVTVDTEQPEFRPLAWEDVCVALRRGMRAGEQRLWQAWAYGFVGSIEQMLIGYPGHRSEQRPLEGLGVKVRIMREGLVDGTED